MSSHPVERIRIGSRASTLALWQSNAVGERLCAAHPRLQVSIVEIESDGDIDRTTPFAALGMTGVFTRRLERALLRDEIDVAVHSLKDLPSEMPNGLVLGAFLPREDARDVLITEAGAGLDALPELPLIATGSPRRRAQILLHRTDARFAGIRGNIETRLSRYRDSGAHALVLAAAGLHRLGLSDRITAYLGLDELVPAPGQGIVVAECRAADTRTRDLLASITHPDAFHAAAAERALLASLGGGCQAPIGAHATVTADELSLSAVVLAPDASRVVRRAATGPATNAADLGRDLAAELIAAGAHEILALCREEPPR